MLSIQLFVWAKYSPVFILPFLFYSHTKVTTKRMYLKFSTQSEQVINKCVYLRKLDIFIHNL